jgi:hypothetical protein
MMCSLHNRLHDVCLCICVRVCVSARARAKDKAMFTLRSLRRAVVFTIDVSLSVHIQPRGHKRGAPNGAVDVFPLAARPTARLRYHEFKCRRSVARAVRQSTHV